MGGRAAAVRQDYSGNQAPSEAGELPRLGAMTPDLAGLHIVSRAVSPSASLTRRPQAQAAWRRQRWARADHRLLLGELGERHRASAGQAAACQRETRPTSTHGFSFGIALLQSPLPIHCTMDGKRCDAALSGASR